MKKIEFIAPVASMRGNLSGDQTLQYAENNNPAFDAPTGRQYAKNYQPRFIGAKRSSDGMTYFATKTKSATLISAESLERMALLGGAAAWYNAAIKSMVLYPAMQLFWRSVKDSYPTYTFRKLMMQMFRQCLQAHEQNVAFTVSGSTTLAANPWFVGATGEAVTISQDILVKFWLQLGADTNNLTPGYFYVAGRKGIMLEGTAGETGRTLNSFEDFGENPTYNVLGLTIDNEEQVKMDGAYLIYKGAGVSAVDIIVRDANYGLAAELPEP